MDIIKKHNKKKIIIFVVTLFAIAILISSIILIVFVCNISSHKPAKIPATTKNTNKTISSTNNTKIITPSFDKTQHSTTDPNSIWLVVNKQHPLSKIDFAPTDLTTSNGATISAKAQADFEAMVAAASAQSVNLVVGSSYRSYATQTALYNSYVASSGQAVADTFSAKPGYSEHQTGLAIDFTGNSNPNCNYSDCYTTTAEGSWLTAHATEYGFLLRYTADKQPITGYKNEPWHYRYIGRELAKEMKKQNITTLEEFFNITGGISY